VLIDGNLIQIKKAADMRMKNCKSDKHFIVNFNIHVVIIHVINKLALAILFQGPICFTSHDKGSGTWSG